MLDEFHKYISLIRREPLFIGVVLAIGIVFGLVLPWPKHEVETPCKENLDLPIVEPVVEASSNSDLIGNIEENKICIDIAGAVNSPGVYCIDDGSILNHLVDLADGFIEGQYASTYVAQNLNLATKLNDGSKVYIPYGNDARCTLEVDSTDIYAGGKDFIADENTGVVVVSDNGNFSEDKNGSGDPILLDDEVCLDLNLATLEELDALEGIGESTAQKIIDARPYTSVNGLLEVSGIGETKLSAIEKFVCVK